MAATLTPRLSRHSDIASPRTPLDFLSPTASLKKKGPVALSCHTGTLAENDDAAEKRQRLLSRVTSLAIQSPGSTTPNTVSRLNSVDTGHTASGSTGLTNTQLKDLYSNCLKLSTENKINAKNAFGLHLIDYMQELLTNLDKDQGVTNFQIASCTLDAGAKIYAGRVDSIHAQAYKMLGGLGRAENGNEGEGIETEGPCEEGGKPKKKKTYKAARTIETNLKNINVDQFDLEFEVDPLFHKTSASFDEGGTRGLLLNHLSCRDDSCEILLDSNIVTTPTMADFSWGNSETLDLSELREMHKRISSQALQICPQFADFCFTNWDKNAETMEDSDIAAVVPNEHAFDMDAPVAFEEPMNDLSDDHSDGDGDDGVGMDEGPSSNITLASLGFADGQVARLVLPGQQRSDGLTGSVSQTVGNLVLSLSSEQSEYSYFKDNTLGMWAGPEHWKNRAQLNAFKGLSQHGSKTKKNRVRKEPFRIDFDASHDSEKLFSEGKVSTVLSQATLDKNSSSENSLPENLHYDHSSLLKLFLKPNLLVRRQYGLRPEVTDDGNAAEWYDYGNQNDCANYCPDVQNDDDDGDVSGGDTVGGFHTDSSQEMSQEAMSFFNSNETVFHGDNLVAQPNRVQKIDIGYAKTAKKIDVKKLKKGMWEIMVDNTSDANVEADKENVPDPTVNQPAEKEIVIEKPCSFAQLYSKIPEKISKNMSRSLSVPIAFVCLLHLANEKTLKILGRTSMEDLSITQGI